MEYDYKSVFLVDNGNQLSINTEQTLQKWFNNDWEYVDCIKQNREYCAIIVILRKRKENQPVNL